MADFLDEKRSEIATRLKELEPLVEEYHRLGAALQALDGVQTPAVGAANGRQKSTRRASRSTGKANGASGGRGRPKGSGNRGKEALSLVKDRQGITIPEIAEAMGMKQNYLYRVLPGLQKDGLVRKEGRGWHPVDAA
jgi:CRP-like cAMP-binding protein